MEKAVSIKDLSFRYKDQEGRNAIENINLEIEKRPICSNYGS